MAKNGIRVFQDVDGTLGVLEFTNLDFTPRRLFWLTDIPASASRANHAHRTCIQLLICFSGTLKARVTRRDSGTSETSLHAGDSIVIRPLEWLELDDFSSGAVLGVIASEPFDKNEYIESLDELRHAWESVS